MKIPANKMYIPLLILWIGLLTNCGLRTDGAMSLDPNTAAGMIYFNTQKSPQIVAQLVADFGPYTISENKLAYDWNNLERKEWTPYSFRMRVLPDKNSFSIAIVDESGKVLTERGSESVKVIKAYLKELMKSV